MKLIILGMLIGYQLASHAHGCNHQLLNFEAEAYHQRIWSNVSSSEDRIMNSLSFFNGPQKQPLLSFENLKNKDQSIDQPYFLEFANNCEKIFNESTDNMDKIAVFKLFKNVRKKSLEHLSYMNEVKKFKQSRSLAIKEEAKILIPSLLTEQSEFSYF